MEEGRAKSGHAAAAEDPAAYCPVCEIKLEPLQCKMVCPTCGYYMSCSDFY